VSSSFARAEPTTAWCSFGFTASTPTKRLNRDTRDFGARLGVAWRLRRGRPQPHPDSTGPSELGLGDLGDVASHNTAVSASARFASSGVHGALLNYLRRCTRLGLWARG
jgi:hypothetical protein